MTLFVLLLASLGFAADGDVQDRVDASLAERHDAGCDSLLALGTRAEVRDALVRATRAEMPPWAPLRAATCLTGLAATDDIAWLATQALAGPDSQPGLVLAVASATDRLPEDRAAKLGALVVERSAADARLARQVLPVLQRSTHPDVRALAPTLDATAPPR